MKIYSIKNEKLNFFNRPIYCESENEALVYIQNVLMSDADRALYSLKDDLALYELGEIDFTTGVITPCQFEYEGSLTDVIRIEASKVCSLAEIFDSIPMERLKPAITRDDLKEIYSRLESLNSKIDSVDAHRVDDLDFVCNNYVPLKSKKGK